MITSIYAGFEELKSNLEITDLQRTTVSTRQQNVRDIIANEMEVLDSFLTGSYIRKTMVAPLSKADIDVFVVLDPKYYGDESQAWLLDRLRTVLLKTYPKTPKISRNGQAVTITFDDFIVDVVPAFNRRGGGYLIPNTSKKVWIPTNPKVHTELMSNENSSHDGDLVPVIKMIKGWNREIDNAFVSFYLELIAIKIFEGVRITDFSSGVRYFFDKGREKIKYKALDPVGYGDHVNGLRNTSTVADAIQRFETAYNRSVRAEKYAQDGYTRNAYEEWSKIIGGYFPTYG